METDKKVMYNDITTLKEKDMKYELKRATKINILISSVLSVVGVLFIAFGSSAGDRAGGAVLLILGIGWIINELMRSKDPKFTFDENGFQIGDTRYSYSDIERIESNRVKHTKYVRIIIDGEVAYRFDNGYENAKEFAKQLTLNGVDHNLFL